MTDRKKREERFKKCNQELEQLVEERAEKIKVLEKQKGEIEKLAVTGRMAAGIAHEINNPLASLKNALFLVRNGVPRDYKYYDYLDRIEDEIDRIRNIVSQLYQLYQQTHQQPTSFNVVSATTEICEMLKPVAMKREIEIHSTSTNDIPDVFLPLGYFKQVLYNLVLNAIEASATGGSVEIAIGEESEKLLIEVTDHGDGIPPGSRPKAFDPFFTTKDKGDGSGLGLGLSVSKNLVTLMGGQIDLKSRVGEGTTFTVTLPNASSEG